MIRRLELFSIMLFALNAGMVGGRITSALADEAGVESRAGELRGAVLSLLAPAVPSRRGELFWLRGAWRLCSS